MKISYRSIIAWGLMAAVCIVLLGMPAFAEEAGPGAQLPEYSDNHGGIIYMGDSRQAVTAIAEGSDGGVISEFPHTGGAAAEEPAAPESSAASETDAGKAAEEAVTERDGEYFVHDGVKYRKGDSMGRFRLSGYDNGACCNGRYAGSATYSGKMPRINHTVAADLDVLPLGTMIIVEGDSGKTVHNYDGVYQVEDKGGGVNGNHLDIFCGSHKEAAAVTGPGWQYSNVWIAVPVEE